MADAAAAELAAARAAVAKACDSLITRQHLITTLDESKGAAGFAANSAVGHGYPATHVESRRVGACSVAAPYAKKLCETSKSLTVKVVLHT